jgi:hypothetical protein
MKQSAAMTSFIIGCFETRTQSHTLNGSPETWTDAIARKTKVSGGMTDSTTDSHTIGICKGLADRQRS